MITKWAVSQKHSEYVNELIVESKTMPTAKTVAGPYYEVISTMTVDSVTFIIKEPIQLLEIDGKKVEKP